MEKRGGIAFSELHSSSSGPTKTCTSICFRLVWLDFLFTLDQPAKDSDQRHFQWDCGWMVLFNVKIS